MMLIAVAFVLICRSANPADVARARQHGRPGGADARPAQTAPRSRHASREDRPYSDASRPRTGRSTGARLYGLTEEEIGIVEATGR